MTNTERKEVLERTFEAIYDINVDALREAGLGWIAEKIDAVYYDIENTLTTYTFEDEEEED